MLEQIARNKRRSAIAVAGFVVVWAAVGAIVGALFAGNASSSGGGIVAGLVVAALVALVGAAFVYSSGARLVLAVAGAHPADGERFVQFHHVVEAMAISAGLPKPAVYVVDDPSPNAFATGVSPDRAAITATTGLLQILNREELEGVVSHEMSHIKNYDVRLILIMTTLIGFAAVIASVLWRSVFVVRLRGRNGAPILLMMLVTAALLTLVAVIVGPLIRFALSRSREELADMSGVELTRNPSGLLHALQKLEANDQPFVSFNHATAAMCIDDPLQHHDAWFHHLFDTHPPIGDRIAILQRVAATTPGS